MKNDPRDKRYYRMQKKDISQLIIEEIKAYLDYCDKMIDCVVEKKGRKGWMKLKNNLEDKLRKSVSWSGRNESEWVLDSFYRVVCQVNEKE